MADTYTLRHTATDENAAAVLHITPEGGQLMSFPLSRDEALGLARDLLEQVERYDQDR